MKTWQKILWTIGAMILLVALCALCSYAFECKDVGRVISSLAGAAIGMVIGVLWFCT